MAADLEMGSLRVEMRKRFCVWEVVAAARESGLGKGSSRAVMWFVILVWWRWKLAGSFVWGVEKGELVEDEQSWRYA